MFDRDDGPLSPEDLEQYHNVKRKMLGNIKFIGEYHIDVLIIAYFYKRSKHSTVDKICK